MSKRNSAGPSNTLFNYFSKTPPTNKKVKLNTSDAEGAPKLDASWSKENIEHKKRERLPTPPDPKDANDSRSKKRKRVRLTIEDSDSEKEDTAVKQITPLKSVKVTNISDEDVPMSQSAGDVSETKTKLLELFKNAEKRPNGAPTCNGAAPPATPLAKDSPEPTAEEGDWVHCKLDWLKPHKIRDAERRRPGDPDYDPTTLHVPSQFMSSQTPAHRQWWEMKARHFDCVLFFKVGKFYELYHMDAAVGVNELGFSYMKGEFAHSGFPESAYARMASTLVSKGYKVARVEQTETPEMMQERCRRTGQHSKFDKVVLREICQVTLRGTQVCGLQDPGPADAAVNYMVAIAEEESQGCSTYGMCFVDASIGLFHLGQFGDDKHSSRLLTTLACYPPALVVYDRKTTTARTARLLATHCPSARREHLPLWSPERTLKTLAEKYYRTDESGDWPDGIRPFLHDGDALGLTPAPNCHLAIKALGGCVAYLTNCLLDLQVLGMAQFTTYVPADVLNKTLSRESKVESKWEGGSTLVLDAITLRNLRIVQDEGCLYDRLNFCTTAMGKRLLYQWVCAPSCNLTVIKERQEAVKTLFENQELCQDAKNILATLPDLERLLAKVHSLGNYLRSKQHPDSRAIFYEEKIYSKKKVLDFIAVLNGFTAALKLASLFEDSDAVLLKRIMQLAPEGKFPDYRSILKFFKDGFDQSQAEKEGRILPEPGMDSEYDDILGVIETIEDELKDYLREQEKIFKCRLSYVGSDKKRYQIEVPVSAVGRAGPGYQMVGTKKGFKKFTTAETRQFLARMMEAEDRKSGIVVDLSRRMFERFSAHHAHWEAAARCVAALDVLLALAEFARQQPGEVCLPDVAYPGDGGKPYINIVEGRHPCIPIANDFIPNDTRLGGEDALLLLTGPNMGGKSTLMRQVGLLTVLAHLGSYVPASACALSAADRVFTRLGASDDILEGQSTFLVEMSETAAIVRHASAHSLVLLDELGRGTSTHDGTAIASAVCAELARRGCRTVFSTHYHSLVRHLTGHPGVVFGHMACMVETDETTPDSAEEVPEETITFLYKLAPGACPKSYGFNAARLAGIPKDITTRAHQVSKKLEDEATCLRAFRDILRAEHDAAKVRGILAELKV